MPIRSNADGIMGSNNTGLLYIRGRSRPSLVGIQTKPPRWCSGEGGFRSNDGWVGDWEGSIVGLGWAE